MNLRRRGVATEAAAAALDVFAAGRFLAGSGIAEGRIRVREGDSDGGADAWAEGIAVVRVSGSAARDAALDTARSMGIPASTEEPKAAVSGGERLAARFELGLWPDETVELVLGPAALRDLGSRLAAFDAALAADPTPRRLVLAGLPEHGPELGPDLIAAIVHPQVLVESEPSPASQLDLLRAAADHVVDEDRA
jgi:hypothetical protein